MKAGWSTVTLDDACLIEYGTRVVQKKDGGSIYPVYGGGGATFSMDTSNRCNRLVVSRFGMSEQCTRFVHGDFFLNDSGLTVAPKSNYRFSQAYLDKHLLHLNDQIFMLGKGSAQKNLDVPAFRQLQINFPEDPSEQQHIVTLLDEAFADIATAKANAEKNLQNALELFESHLQAAFKLQEDWTLKSFGDLAEFRNGINFTKSSKGEAIKIVGVRDFQKNFWAPLDDLETIIPEGEMPASDLIQSGDILFVRSNGNPELIGRSLLVGDLQEPITHSGFTIKARLRDAQLSPIYLCHYLKSGLLRREMIEGGNGANIKSLNQGTLSRLKIAFPDKAKQLIVVEQLEKVQAEIAELESIYCQKLTALDDLKKSLLHQAFSGQL